MVHTLKALWTSESGETEIRRMTIHDDVISSFLTLCDKIVQLFPQLQGKEFQLGWKDSEDDYIVMSSDAELDQAVANALENGLIKVFVTSKGKGAPNAKMASGGRPKSSAVHTNVVCDACNHIVCGYRYKCLECSDYDLCESCHAEDKHPGHDMLKITRPVGQALNWIFPGWRRMYRSMFGQEPFIARCCAKMKPEFKNEKEGRENVKQDNGKNLHAEFLKNVGKSVAFFLDPLGIDVDVMVSENGAEPVSCGMKKKAGKPTAMPNAGNMEPKNNGEENTKENAKSESTSPESDQPTSSCPQNEEKATDLSAQGARPKNYGLFQPSVSTPVENKMEGKEENDQAESKESTPDNLSSSDDWTVVNDVPNGKDDKSCATEPEPVDINAKVSYPSLPEEIPSCDGQGTQKASTPIDLKIANAMEKMCAMGFNNDGGWLQRLLETKNGNINEVLDAMYPHRR